MAEFHEQLPRGEASSFGAVYARYSTRFQDSIVDQIRKLLEDSVNRGIFVPREFVFFDLAVRGSKKQRLGLDALRDVLSQRRVNVLLLFATNRLFRKVFRTLAFVDQAVKEWGIRCIFVQTGVDSDDENRWEMLLHMHSMMDEFAVSMDAENIRAAQEGLFLNQMVFGTITYGYTGVPIPDQFTRRGHRHGH